MPKEIDYEAVKQIATEQRDLVELFKKGLGSAESITEQEFNERQLWTLNRFENLLGLPVSYWSKDEDGKPILTQAKQQVRVYT